MGVGEITCKNHFGHTRPRRLLVLFMLRGAFGMNFGDNGMGIGRTSSFRAGYKGTLFFWLRGDGKWVLRRREMHRVGEYGKG